MKVLKVPSIREGSSRMRPCIHAGKIRQFSHSNMSFTDDKGLKRLVKASTKRVTSKAHKRGFIDTSFLH